ncbi:MAG: YsnF/AvaK domain-containing protein [Bacteroidetes bacterium]|nr:YsnF/AvaK domain-containing protein [Bacteroidota bacterium]
MKQTVIGIYDNRDKAKQAEQDLLRSGFDKNQVDISSSAAGAADIQDNDRHSSFFGSLFGGNDEEARRHAEVAQRGTVVTVHTQSMNDAERAAAILDKFGTIDVDDASFTRRSGAETATGKTTDRTSDIGRNTGDKNIPIIEENLEIGKREVETGGARLRSRIVERPIEEHMRLREEHISIDRQPVNRPASEADLRNFKEGTIDATAHAEVPVVDKEARVVEEINIHKEVSDRDEVVRDSVRKTEVDVDKVKSKERESGY